MSINIKRIIGGMKLGIKKNAPELLLVGAFITGTACVVTSVRATIKADEIRTKVAKSKEDMITAVNEGHNEVEVKNTMKSVYGEVVVDYIKQYAIPTTLFVATTGLVFASYKIQKNRQIALSSALASATLAYSTLLSKVKNGAEVGLTAQQVLDGVEVKKTVNEETGEVMEELVQCAPTNGIYNFRFDKEAGSWENDSYMNICTLNAEQQWADNKLKLEGFIFLNDVLDRLGLPRTKSGQVVGWRSNGDGDGFVEFGIVDCSTNEGPTWNDNAYDLCFNCDGDILTDFPRE